MKTHICCKNCGSIFLGESSWRGAFVTCPYCHQTTYFGFDDPCPKSDDNFVWMVCGGIGIAFVLLICIAVAGIWIGEKGNTDTSSNDLSSRNNYLSFRGKIAKDYIENHLPSSQRDALMGTGGTEADRANALANLSKSGNLSGAAEYLASIGQ